MSKTLTFLHGTTVERAQTLSQSQNFLMEQTYFVLGANNRPTAQFFAERAASREPRGGGPALVLVEVEEDTVNLLRRNGWLKLTTFDVADDPRLQNRTQWLLEAPGVPILNRELIDMTWEQL